MPTEGLRSQAELLAYVEGLVERSETGEAFAACKATAESIGFSDAQRAASLGLSDLSKCALDELNGLPNEREIKGLNLRALKLAEEIASRPTVSRQPIPEEAKATAAEFEAWVLRQSIDPASPAGRLAFARKQLKELTVARASHQEIERAKNAVIEARRDVRQGNRLREGDVLADRYEVVECVGSGGFATVWRCYDNKSSTVVAVKVLHPSHRDEGRRKERFFRGARLMKQLSHEYVVTVLDEECHDEQFHFYVMELIDGPDLKQAVLNKELNDEELLRVICESGEALAYAHRKIPDLIHRDVKPSNILLTEDKQAKVTDFDLVRAADTTGGTRTGSLGTFIYAAPETLEDAGRVDVSADVFSLGMTAVFGLYGRELGATAFRRTENIIESLDCANAVKDVLTKAVEWEVEERYSTMQEFVGSLRKAMNSNEPAAIESSTEGISAVSKPDEKIKANVTEADQAIATLAGHSDAVFALAAHPDGRRLISGSYDHTLKVWDLESGKELVSLAGHSNTVWALALHPDGRRLVSGS
ncbi:MAG: serine/threonine-protein kinase, partial [Planctomycetota bacterium]